jgi:hypothetical protein
MAPVYSQIGNRGQALQFTFPKVGLQRPWLNKPQRRDHATAASWLALARFGLTRATRHAADWSGAMCRVIRRSISKPRHLNRSITLSIIDEISGASADISAFIVQLRRALNS